MGFFVNNKAMDKDFTDYFGANPPVLYIRRPLLAKKYARNFRKKYDSFYKKHRSKLSKTRKHHLDIFFRRFDKLEDDSYFNDKVHLRYISKKIGYGVFAKQYIPPYTTLQLYSGEVIPTKKLNADHDSTFSFEFFEDYSIDAMHKGNWTRFMNHSDISSSNCNVCVWEYYRKDLPYIVFSSGKNGIQKGDQLLYSYGEEYWEDRAFQDLT